MNDGWRSRFIAAVSALVISFVSVIIIQGAGLDHLMRIQFTIPEFGPNSDVSKRHVKELSELRVSLGAADPGTADGGKLIEGPPSLEFTVLKPNEENIRICTTLPPHWSSPESEEVSDGKTCWPKETHKDVKIQLSRQGD